MVIPDGFEPVKKQPKDLLGKHILYHFASGVGWATGSVSKWCTGDRYLGQFIDGSCHIYLADACYRFAEGAPVGSWFVITPKK